ncbi:hypothetical protein IKF02_00935 [Candidatus Saccharibacteria bacterium]|nr:hypothetical protein [Candidatus Saccharibacteria bacterium]MBR3143796.1 hypothetical protein [Candidatus Saccharibacteria bacterium]
MQRLLVIYNPRSTRYKSVKSEVLDKLPNLKGYIIGKYTIKKIGFEGNVKDLSKVIKDGDLIISAGGDATAAISANAIIKSGKDATLGVLPYGNFNDLARTLKTHTLDDIISQNQKPVKLYPLEIIVDGKFWRYATCYVTIGMTAEAVELFDEQKVRTYLQKGHKSSWRSYIYLMKWYFKNRHKKIFLPGLKINGATQHKKTSDYAALSGRSMCRVMKGREDYLKPKVFRSTAKPLANFWPLFTLMTKSIFYRVPGDETTGDKLEFSNPTTIELQAEGEYQIFQNVKTVEVKKGTKCLKVVQN